MRFVTKSTVSIAALTTAVLATAACSSSGQVGSSAGSTGGKNVTGTSAASSAPTSGGKSSASSSSSSASGSSSSSASSSAGGSATAPTADQISKLLLTDKDDPGYTFDPAQDDTGTTDTQEPVTAGGADCQKFVDAQDALTTKYGTVAEVDRQLKKSAENHAIQDGVVVLPSADKAQALIADLTDALKTCTKLTMKTEDAELSMQPAPIPTLMTEGHAAYVNYMTNSGKTVLMTAELTRVGTTVSVVILIGPVTDDKTSLQQMGATLSHLSDIQADRLRSLQGLS